MLFGFEYVRKKRERKGKEEKRKGRGELCFFFFFSVWFFLGGGVMVFREGGGEGGGEGVIRRGEKGKEKRSLHDFVLGFFTGNERKKKKKGSLRFFRVDNDVMYDMDDSYSYFYSWLCFELLEEASLSHDACCLVFDEGEGVIKKEGM